MPTVLRIGPYRFHFYTIDGNEPPHIHVRRDRNEAKFWLDPVRLAVEGGFSGPELRRIERHVSEHEQTLLDAWHDYFSARTGAEGRSR